MAAIDIDDLIERIRNRADLANSTFVTDAEITTEINASLGKLWNLLIRAAPEFYVAYDTLTVTSGNTTGLFDMPTDYYGTIGVDFRESTGIYRPLKRIPLAERNNYDWSNRSTGQGYTFDRSAGADNIYPQLRILPPPVAGQVYRHVYTIAAPTLESGGAIDSFESINGYEEYVVLDVCIKLLSKEETATGVYERDRDIIKQELEDAAELRTLAEPGRIADYSADDWEILDPADFWIR